MEQDQISLRELCRILWREKRIVLTFSFCCAILGLLMAWVLPKQYEAAVLVSAVSSNSTGGRLAEQVSSLGSLSSLVGINLGGDSAKYESVAVLQSQALTEQYIRDHDLMPLLLTNRVTTLETRWFGPSPARTPTLWKADRVFSKLRTVTEDRRTGLITVSVRWSDPVTAAKWANDLVALTNDDLRARAIQVTEQHIDYLNHEAAKTDVTEVRSAIYAVLESEIKNAMLARGQRDYALKVLDPAVPPEVSSGPKRSLWFLGGFGVGLLLSFLVLAVRNAWRADSRA